MKKTKDQIQEEALTALKYVKRGSIGVSVGVGKTLIGLKHMASMYNDSSFFLVILLLVLIYLLINKIWTMMQCI